MVKKTRSNYSAVPPVIKMEYYIIIANITSWNLIITNLMLSTNQLLKQRSYGKHYWINLFYYWRKKTYYFPPLWIKSAKNLKSTARLNTTALYFSKLGSTHSMNEPNAFNLLLIRFQSFTRNLSIFKCGVSLESVTFNGTKYKENKLKAVFSIILICKLCHFACLQWVILNIHFCENGNTYISACLKCDFLKFRLFLWKI